MDMQQSDSVAQHPQEYVVHPSSNYACGILTTLKENSDKTLLVVEGESATGQQLHHRVTAVAGLLKWKGVSPNDRVLITMQPSIEFYVVSVAVLAIGGAIIIIDPSMGMERCDHCIATAKPTVWVWSKGSKFKFLKYLLPSFRSIPIPLELASHESPKGVEDLLEPAECVPVDHALVTFTTGSTGMPKLLLRKHAFLLNQTLSLSLTYELVAKRELNMEEKDASYATNLPVFPLHFLRVGSLCVLFPKFLHCNPVDVIKTLKKHDVTGITGSPAFVEKLASHALKHNTALPVRYTGVGGAPVFRGVLRTISSATPNRNTVVVYGSTEAEPISCIYAAEKMEVEASLPEGHCVGRPVFKGSTKVIRILSATPSEPVDVAGELELPAEEIGEIIISGWHVNTYQVETKRLITDLDGTVWLRIEDAGFMDVEGRLWLVGRVKWRVEREGKTYWSTVVEQKILDRCSLVTFAAYLPHPLNEEAWLFLEAPKGLPDAEKAGIESFLSREGIPVDKLEIKDHIPRDRRHASKPNTATLFGASNPNSPSKLLKLFLKANPMVAVILIFVQLVLIACVVVWIFSQ